MKTYLINLDRRPDRLREMTERLAALSLPFERISAVDGKTADLRGKVAWVRATLYGNILPPPLGHVACFFSHRAIWQKMVDENIPVALVLEDDVIPVAWDAAILRVELEKFGLDQLRIEKTPYPVINPFPMGKQRLEILQRIAVNEPSYGAGAYIITLSGAKKCLVLNKFYFYVDGFDMLSRVVGLKTAILLPIMWKQSDSASDTSPGSNSSVFVEGQNPSFGGKFGEAIALSLKRLVGLLPGYRPMMSAGE